MTLGSSGKWWLLFLLKLIALSAAYIATAAIGQKLDVVHDRERVLLPQSGIALAGLTVLGIRYWPAVLISSATISLTAERPLLSSLFFATGNCLAAVLGAMLLRRKTGYRPGMLSVHDVYAFVLYGIVMAPVVNAVFAAMGLSFGAPQFPGTKIIGEVLWKRWFGHGVSNLIVAPLILTWARRPELNYPPVRILETLFLGATLLWVSLTVFTGQSAIATLNYPVSFAPFPVVLWAALRYGPRGAASATFLIAAMAILGTSQGFGPFVRTERDEGLVLLQVYLMSVALTALFLGSAMAERREAIGRLTQSQEELRALSSRLQLAREDERTAIAREIHDELGQQLTGLKMGIHAAIRKLPPDATDAIEKLKTVSSYTDEAVESVRRIASDLRPGILDDLGLCAASQWWVEEFTSRTGIPATFQCTLEEPEVSSAIKTALFRILQEALTNVARHAQATQVEVTLEVADKRLVLKVRDNGIGIGAEESTGMTSLGIIGMNERAGLLGGTLELSRAGDRGTLVRAQIPFEQVQS